MSSSDLAEVHEHAAHRHRSLACCCDDWKVAEAHLAAASLHLSQADAIRTQTAQDGGSAETRPDPLPISANPFAAETRAVS